MSNYLNQIESDLYKLNSITNDSGEVVEMVAELKEKYRKAKAWDEALERWNDIENDTEEFIHIGNDPDLYYNDFRRVLKKYKRGDHHD